MILAIVEGTSIKALLDDMRHEQFSPMQSGQLNISANSRHLAPRLLINKLESQANNCQPCMLPRNAC